MFHRGEEGALPHLFMHLPLLFATLSSIGTDLDRLMKAAGERWRTGAIIRTPTFWWDFWSLGNNAPMRAIGGVLEKHVPTGIFSSSLLPFFPPYKCAKLWLRSGASTDLERAIKTGGVRYIFIPT